MAEYEPLIIESGPGLHARRYRRPASTSTASAACGATSTGIGIRGSTRRCASSSTGSRTSPTSARANPTTIRLAKRLVDLAPPRLESRFFLRRWRDGRRSRDQDRFSILAAAARAAAAEDAILALDAAYHGDTIGARQRRRRSTAFTRCSSRCCSTRCACRRRTCTGCRKASRPNRRCRTTWAASSKSCTNTTRRSPPSSWNRSCKARPE